MSDLNRPTSTSLKAGQPALVRSFVIEKLYGYRTISLESEYAATVLIARNGTGKTTLLGAMDAFLKLQLNRLLDLSFDRIRCRLRGSDDEISVSHDDIIRFLQVPEGVELSKLSTRIGVEPSALFNWLLSSGNANERDERSSEENVGISLRRSFSYSSSEIENALDRVREEVYQRIPSLYSAWKIITATLKDIEVVYLPTYRRVELALREDKRTDPYGRSRTPRFSVAAGSLHTGEIQFGLGDISDRLRSINNNIISTSNNGYRRISANIINDLLDSSFMNYKYNDDDLPSQEELSLFFSRIKDSRRTSPYEPVVAPNLDRLFGTQKMPETSRQFLAYFLAQLGQVIDASKDVEAPVDSFINVCNKYLSSEEPSTEIDPFIKRRSYDDGKMLCLNRRNLSVHVESLPEKRKISLNALSSGEKQMISLFAKLFLYPKRKLVLIDEPELSLSIDWQSSILVDVLNAPLCEQVIAITHSPFVFENELDPFARTIQIAHDQPPAADAIDDLYGLEFDDDAE